MLTADQGELAGWLCGGPDRRATVAQRLLHRPKSIRSLEAPSELNRGPRVGVLGSGEGRLVLGGVACCTCCSVVRLPWRCCVCTRASSRSSRSWCSATNWLCFAARSLVHGWMSLTAFSLLRP